MPLPPRKYWPDPEPGESVSGWKERCRKELSRSFNLDVLPGMAHPVKTHDEINRAGNSMAQIDGNYPVGMSGCFVVGINGGCGLDCPVYLDGECGEPDEMLPGLTPAELSAHHELYPTNGAIQ